jgi:hypothetical protein
MPVFNERFYKSAPNTPDVDGYRAALKTALSECATPEERDMLLRSEATEMTKHVTDGVLDLINRDRRIHNLVLNQGAVPLASWMEKLNRMAKRSLPELQGEIAEMRRDLEQGRIQGFPGTMVLYGKPTFTTLEVFYNVVFAMAE